MPANRAHFARLLPPPALTHTILPTWFFLRLPQAATGVSLGVGAVREVSTAGPLSADPMVAFESTGSNCQQRLKIDVICVGACRGGSAGGSGHRGAPRGSGVPRGGGAQDGTARCFLRLFYCQSVKVFSQKSLKIAPY